MEEVITQTDQVFWNSVYFNQTIVEERAQSREIIFRQFAITSSRIAIINPWTEKES